MKEYINQKCFICDRKLSSPDIYNSSCWPATVFTSRGNWGSTIIDGMGEIEIWICDVCVTERIDKVNGYHPDYMNNKVREDVMEWYNDSPRTNR